MENLRSFPRILFLFRRACSLAFEAFLSLCLFAALASAELPESAPEYAVKAAFLVNFTKFIKWPVASSAERSEQRLQICIYGEDPFGSVLDEIVAKGSESQPLTLRRIAKTPDAKDTDGCKLLFFSSLSQPELQRLKAPWLKNPTVTVSDSMPGALITLFVDRGTVRFKIDLQALKESGVEISSRMLRLAATE